MYALQVGTRFLLNDTEYEVLLLSGDKLIVNDLSYGIRKELALNDILNSWAQNNVIFKNRNPIEADEGRSRDVFSELPNDKRDEARARYNLLKPVIDGEISSHDIKNYLKDKGMSRTQFYIWMKRWEMNEDISALVSKRRGPKSKRTHKEVLELINDIVDEFCYEGEKHSDESLYNELLLRINDINKYRVEEDHLQYISISTFRRTKREIVDIHKINEAQLGKIETNRRRRGSKDEVVVKRPLERVEIDWTPVDVMLINPETGKRERPNLIYGIDKFTGHPLGYYIKFGAVDTDAIKQCILHIIMPKRYLENIYPNVKNEWITYGKPQTIVLDNARVNESQDLEDALLQLKIQTQYVGVGLGNQKGTIERAFRTLNDKYFHSLPGTTFSNVQEKGLYDSEGKACISLMAFNHIVHLIMVDDIAQRHSEKRKGSPVQLWKNAIDTNPHLVFPLAQTVDDLKLALISGFERRVIHESGVIIEKEHYQSDSLMKLRASLIAKYGKSKKVKVRFDLADMREVYVWDELNGNYIKATQVGIKRRGINFPEHIIYRRLDNLLGKNPDVLGERLNEAETKREVLKISKEERKNLRKKQKQQKVDNNIIEDVKTEKSLAGINGVEFSTKQIELSLVSNSTSVEESKKGKKSKKTKGAKKEQKTPKTDMELFDLSVSTLEEEGL